MKQKQVIPLLQLKTKVPIVEFTTDNKNKYYAMVDSGAETSLLDQQFIKENNLPVKSIGSSISFISLNGEIESQKVYGAEANVKFPNSSDADNTIIIRGIESNMSAINEHFEKENGIKLSALIGSDILKALDGEIDYETGVIRISNDIRRKRQARHN